MGKACKDGLRIDFDHAVKLEFHGPTVSSDGGLLAYHEFDEAFALTAIILAIRASRPVSAPIPSVHRSHKKALMLSWKPIMGYNGPAGSGTLPGRRSNRKSPSIPFENPNLRSRTQSVIEQPTQLFSFAQSRALPI